MGLDMTLYCEKYISNNFEDSSEEKEMLKKIHEMVNIPKDTTLKSTIIHVRIFEWRKAYFIHNWFVNNVLDGDGNCQFSYVDPFMLKELKDVCKEILDFKTTGVIKDGKESYFTDSEIEELDLDLVIVKETYDYLKILTENSNFLKYDYYYSASW